MRLITWNCRGAFGKKHAAVAALNPDVLVVPEAGQLGNLPNVRGAARIRSCEWVGSTTTRGLGVVSYGDYSLRVHEAYDPRHRWILPLHVDGPLSFTLFAVWTVKDEETGYYCTPLFEALETYRDILGSPGVVWAGDFNQSTLFDKPSDSRHFSHWISKAEEHGLKSLYHLKALCDHGAEREQTFFLYGHKDKAYHIDFIFAKPSLYEAGFELVVGKHRRWSGSSDHMPLIFTTHQ
jgi:exodeoxyribonuclease-3